MEAKQAKVSGAVTIGLPVGKPTTDVKKANDSASQAKGVACAEVAFTLLVSQFGALKRVVTDLKALDVPGRKAFRITIKGKLFEQRAWLKAQKAQHGDDAIEVAARALRSLTTKTSQLEALSTALDRGWQPDIEAHTYPMLCSLAVAYNRANASSGPTRRKGRPETAFIDKLKAFMVREAGDDSGKLRDAAIFCNTLAKVKGTDALM
jgi:hypothetical protein